VQVDPTKPALKAPGTKRLKLKYDEPLSNFAVKFMLRRYSEVLQKGGKHMPGVPPKVRRCRLTVSNPALKAPMVQLLKLEYDGTISNFAFNFNSRRYTKPALQVAAGARCAAKYAIHLEAGAYTRPLGGST